jgi:radical SAM superfamily enzyme YgiQ (UPF0313 family)
MITEKMHFTGQIWRPPFEANSVLLQATVGCSHNKCKFCSLYDGTTFKTALFSELEEDLKIVRKYQPRARRVFLTGANPFVLSYNKLVKIALLIHDNLPEMKNIGGFARITDIKTKTLAEWKDLRRLGYDRISIGVESGDDVTLAYMKKGYMAHDIIEQCLKLQDAGIEYNFTYLNGLAGKGNGLRNALESAKIFSHLRPFAISIVSLTVFPESNLYQEVLDGTYLESSEHERLEEMKALIGSLMLDTPFTLLANTVSNPVPLIGFIPNDREKLIREIQMIIENTSETDLKQYRKNIKSL